MTAGHETRFINSVHHRQGERAGIAIQSPQFKVSRRASSGATRSRRRRPRTLRTPSRSRHHGMQSSARRPRTSPSAPRMRPGHRSMLGDELTDTSEQLEALLEIEPAQASVDERAVPPIPVADLPLQRRGHLVDAERIDAPHMDDSRLLVNGEMNRHLDGSHCVRCVRAAPALLHCPSFQSHHGPGWGRRSSAGT